MHRNRKIKRERKQLIEAGEAVGEGRGEGGEVVGVLGEDEAEVEEEVFRTREGHVARESKGRYRSEQIALHSS